MQFRYSMHIDLVYHVLSYMKVDNASNCYNQQYIDKMTITKKSFDFNIESALNKLQNYYNVNFNRLMMINFLPFNCTSYDEMKQLFLNHEGFTKEDIQNFLLPFIDILDKEVMFYFPYWRALHNSYINKRNEIEQWLGQELDKYKCVFDHFNKSLVLYLSYSMKKNGRGFGSDVYFNAFTPFEYSKDLYFNTFFQALHEYTHQITDILISNISMDNNSHNTSEYVVILADYYIVKAYEPKVLGYYYEWLSRLSENTLNISTDKEFFDIFKIENELDIQLKKMLYNITGFVG